MKSSLKYIVFFSCIEKDVGKLCKASHFIHLIIDSKCNSIFLASGENVVLKLELESDDEEERNEPNEADKENLPDNELLTPMKEGSPGLKVKDEVTSQDSQADSQEEEGGGGRRWEEVGKRKNFILQFKA